MPRMWHHCGLEVPKEQSRWTDYDGDQPYRDFRVTPGNPPTFYQQAAFEPGLWRSLDGTTQSGKYLHNDMLGTQRLRSGLDTQPGEKPVFTAFGERVDPGGFERYGYVGAWGYQDHSISSANSPDAFPFLHVGARYYDPANGRFLQRDPIGAAGGPNVYPYAANAPTALVDPSGLHTHDSVDALIDWTGSQGRQYHPGPAPAIGLAGFVGGGLVILGGGYVLPAVARATGSALAGVAGSGYASLGTRDPGFLRWGVGVISERGPAIIKGRRIAMGGPHGGWRFHFHLHRLNWWRPWKWFMAVAKSRIGWKSPVKGTAQPLAIYDPRRGASFSIQFTRRDVFRLEEHNWITLASTETFDFREQDFPGLVEQIARAYAVVDLYIQIGPGAARWNEAEIYPSAWSLRGRTKRSLLFHVLPQALLELRPYFGRVSLYENWTCYINTRPWNSGAIPFHGEPPGIATFVAPGIPWDVLIWCELDSNTFVSWLPKSAATDQLLDAMVSEGRAYWSG